MRRRRPEARRVRARARGQSGAGAVGIRRPLADRTPARGRRLPGSTRGFPGRERRVCGRLPAGRSRPGTRASPRAGLREGRTGLGRACWTPGRAWRAATGSFARCNPRLRGTEPWWARRGGKAGEAPAGGPGALPRGQPASRERPTEGGLRCRRRRWSDPLPAARPPAGRARAKGPGGVAPAGSRPGGVPLPANPLCGPRGQARGFPSVSRTWLVSELTREAGEKCKYPGLSWTPGRASQAPRSSPGMVWSGTVGSVTRQSLAGQRMAKVCRRS